MQYKGYTITIAQGAVYVYKDGKYVRKFATEEEALEYIDEQE